MSPRPRDIIGQRFNKLVAIELVEDRKDEGKRDRVRVWRCRCDCGNEPTVAQRNLTAGDTKSCGCIIGKHKRTHGATGTSEFRIWDGILRRCRNETDERYPMYGGRGISVCERWLKFENFFADMGPRPSRKHSVDRIDNDGNYEPGNCRWATMREQSNNRRSNLWLTYNGETHTAAEWDRRLGLKSGHTSIRLKQGWSIERALSTTNRDCRRRQIDPVQPVQSVSHLTRYP